MKTPMLMLAALSLGTAAIAQMPAGSAQPAAPDGATPAPPMTPDASAPATTSPATPTQAAPMDPAAPSAPMTPAAPDAAASMPMGAGAGGAPMASNDTSSYPPCSRTVKDKCINRGASTHKAMRHKR